MGFASLYPSYKIRLRVLAARSARSDAIGDALENEEGAGKAGCPQHPRSCAKMHTGDRKVRRNTRPSLRNGFTAYSALFPATNSSCHRR
jgi:hypothetical protein